MKTEATESTENLMGLSDRQITDKWYYLKHLKRMLPTTHPLVVARRAEIEAKMADVRAEMERRGFMNIH